MTVAQRLRWLRQRHGWKLEQVAHKLDVSMETVCRWESGRIVHARWVRELAAIYGCSVEWIQHGTGRRGRTPDIGIEGRVRRRDWGWVDLPRE
jgi:transcriptional regulator with XRE-family HTH domain